jgi:hypothetical protein
MFTSEQAKLFPSSYVGRFTGTVNLTVDRTHPRTSAASDAGPLVLNHHDLSHDFVVVQIDDLVPVRQSLERHHLPAADFETSTAADTGRIIDSQKIIRLPITSIAGVHELVPFF